MPRLMDLSQKLQEKNPRAELTKAVERELGLPSGTPPAPALQDAQLLKTIFDKLKQKEETPQVNPPVPVTGGA